MKKVKFGIIGILIIAAAVTCKVSTQESDGFFYLCNGYVADAKNNHLSLAFTYFYENACIDFDDVTSISFHNSKLTQIESYQIFQMEKKKRFKSYGIVMDINFVDRGMEQIENISIRHSSGKEDIFPIGTWVFDIDEEDCNLLDTWSSPAVSGEANKFVYNYMKLDNDIDVKMIQYGKDSKLKVSYKNEMSINGIVDLESETPMNYIKTKIFVMNDGKYKLSYGKGCYCGGLNVSEDSILKSQILANQKIN